MKFLFDFFHIDIRLGKLDGIISCFLSMWKKTYSITYVVCKFSIVYIREKLVLVPFPFKLHCILFQGFQPSFGSVLSSLKQDLKFTCLIHCIIYMRLVDSMLMIFACCRSLVVKIYCFHVMT